MTRTFLKTMPGALVLSAILTVTAAAQRETETKPHTTRRSTERWTDGSRSSPTRDESVAIWAAVHICGLRPVRYGKCARPLSFLRMNTGAIRTSEKSVRTAATSITGLRHPAIVRP